MALLLCVILLLSFNARADKIDWEYETTRTTRFFQEEYDHQTTSELVHEMMAPGFVRVTPHSIIKGDLDALVGQLTKREHKGHYNIGPVHIAATCGNTALVWRNLSFVDNGSNGQDGTFVTLYEYTDGMAKEKFLHSTL